MEVDIEASIHLFYQKQCMLQNCPFTRIPSLGFLPPHFDHLDHEIIPLHILQHLIDQDDRRRPAQHNIPFRPSQRHDSEDPLQHRRVEQDEMEDHGQCNGVDQYHVIPEWKRHKGLGRRERVHGVKHLDHDKNRKGDCRSGACRLIGEYIAVDFGEERGAFVEVCLHFVLVLNANIIDAR